ncbi:hypothetical protein C357_23205 [Citreicella sp. 357]|nr:hypothetical protein C357_23205 [Citreicella sp. 357]
MAFASDVAKADKMFSDLLPRGFNEFHANTHGRTFVRGTIKTFSDQAAETSLRMYSHFKPDLRDEDCPQTSYARSLIEAVKAASKTFRRTHKAIGQQINNIDVLVDMSEHNTGPIFKGIVQDAMMTDGLFRGVNSVVAIDSSVSRMIQLADAIAYLRHLAIKGEISNKELDQELRITLF